ncbi:MAG: alanine--glyoxylate aminotransferase family protein [Candidatus Bipolaricaulota bacterium]|nr:MAG: alanine--glyoxylate aminotransferase family protein [Candidatus Bipolaricaulota bacterium]
MHKRLFTPGPTEVRAEILKELATPQIHHRSPECAELYGQIQPNLQQLLYTENPVLLFASSSTGAMEAAVTNLVAKRCLNCVNGAFSARWHDIAAGNGVPCDVLEAPWDRAIRPEQVDEKLATGEYDAVTLVFNETSTGLMNPLKEIAEVVKRYPEVMLLVDAVSAMAGVKIDTDALDLAFVLAGVQKAFALPAGLTVAAVSEDALARAESVPPRSYYFSLPQMAKYHRRNQTPSTPAIPQMFALNAQLTAILEEGLEARFERHAAMAKTVQEWAKTHFDIYPEEGYWSSTLTCVRNTREVDVAAMIDALARGYNLRLANGYGAIKGETFRVAHMGDTQPDEIAGLLRAIEAVLGL